MSKIDSSSVRKPVFARLTSKMTRDQKVQAVVDVLEKNGITVKPSSLKNNTEGVVT